ncbi:hypothetical protein CHUAL_004052 [Chamberlinius hualienensis]
MNLINDEMFLHSATLEGNLGGSHLLKWSEDNVLAVSTMEGLHLFNLVLNDNLTGKPVSLKREAIRPPNDVLERDFGVDLNQCHHFLPREDWFYVSFDRTLAPHNLGNVSYAGFRETIWSPKGLGENNTCCLAVLTAESRMLLYGRCGNSWEKMADISELLYKHLTEKKVGVALRIEGDSFHSENLVDFRSKCYASATARLVWSHLFKNDDSQASGGFFSYLFSAQKDGSVAVWKVNSFPNLDNNFELVKLFDGEVGTVSSIHWIEMVSQSGYLAVGGINGRCNIFKISSNGLSDIVSQKITLWSEADKISVSAISSCKTSSNVDFILCCKGGYLIGWKADGNHFTEVGRIFGGFSQYVTGIEGYSNGFVMCAADETVVKVELDLSNKDFKIKLKNILPDIKVGSEAGCGIALSPNKSVVCVLKCIKHSYNHLVIKEPISMGFYSFDNLVDVSNKLQILMKCDESFLSFTDILFYLYNNFLKTDILPPILLSLLQLKKERYKDETTSTLRVLRWLYSFAPPLEQDVDGCESSVVLQQLAKKKVTAVENVIIQRNFLNFAKRVQQSSSEVVIKFKERLRLIASWFQKSGDILNSENAHLLEGLCDSETCEKCQICQSDIPLNKIRHGTCSKGHTQGRCFISLAICDLIKQRRCRKCHILADSEAVDLIGDQACPLCLTILQ